MNVLFVVPYPIGVAASQRFRVEQFLPILQRRAIDYNLAPFWDKKTWAILYKRGNTFQKLLGLANGFCKRLLLLKQLKQYDYIFIHREATPLGPPWFEWFASKVLKLKVIYDLDDALWLPNITDTNRTAANFKQHQKVNKILKWAYQVSCGNDYILKHAKQFNDQVVYLPTVVDTYNRYKYLKDQHAERVTIGWTGSHSTLPYLELIEPVLLKLQHEFDFNLVVISDKNPELNIRNYRFIAWQQHTEIQDLLSCHIGLMPLPDTEWAFGKCGFKAIQYMALGIPAVVSAVGANKSILPDGQAGYLCTTEEDWYRSLKKLLQNEELRSEMGAKGKAWVQENYALSAYQHVFLQLFT